MVQTVSSFQQNFTVVPHPLLAEILISFSPLKPCSLVTHSLLLHLRHPHHIRVIPILIFGSC